MVVQLYTYEGEFMQLALSSIVSILAGPPTFRVSMCMGMS